MIKSTIIVYDNGEEILTGTLEGKCPISLVLDNKVYVNTGKVKVIDIETNEGCGYKTETTLYYTKSELTVHEHYCEPVIALLG
jgi:hypothetical protein